MKITIIFALALALTALNGLGMDKPSELPAQNIKRPNVYQCQYPGCQEFHSSATIRQHILYAHLQELEIIQESPEAFSANLKARIQQYMPKFDYVCSCKDSFPSLHALNNHARKTKHFVTYNMMKEFPTPPIPKAFHMPIQGAHPNMFSFSTNPIKWMETSPVKKAAASPTKANTSTPATSIPSQEKLQCQGCKEGYYKDYLNYLKYHIYLHHVVSKKCSDCNIQFSEIEDFTGHLKKYHKKDILIPQNLSLTERKKLNLEIAKHLPKLKFECPLCSDLYFTQETLNAHYTQAHGTGSAPQTILQDLSKKRKFEQSESANDISAGLLEQETLFNQEELEELYDETN